MEKEHKIQNDIRVGLTEAGCLVFRANVGKVRTQMDGISIQVCQKVLVTCLDLDLMDKYFSLKLKTKRVV